MKVYLNIVLEHHQWCQILGSGRLQGYSGSKFILYRIIVSIFFEQPFMIDSTVSESSCRLMELFSIYRSTLWCMGSRALSTGKHSTLLTILMEITI